MKNLVLIVAFLGFMVAPSFAATTLTNSFEVEFCEDGKKCDKKDCKHKKHECKKDGKKACCSKDAKASTKKSCCAGAKGKKCSKSTTKTTEK